MTRLVLGVDGGATKTVALIVEGDGEVRGAGRSGSSDIHSETPPSRAIENVVAAVTEAMRSAGVSSAELGRSVFGLCGADWPEDISYYTEHLRARLSLPAAPVVVNDAFNSLRAGTDDGIGVALVLGTGGAIASRGSSGEWCSGERMERSGALELGRVVYDTLIRAEYADGPRPAYEPAALRIFGVDSVEALVYAITASGGAGYRSVSRLAPALLGAAHAGDVDSQRVIREQSERLAGYVRVAGSRVGLGDGQRRLILAGGLVRNRGSHLRDTIEAALPDYVVSVPQLEPVYGAVLMAADLEGLAASAGRLRRSGPEPAFFATAVSDT